MFILNAPDHERTFIIHFPIYSQSYYASIEIIRWLTYIKYTFFLFNEKMLSKKWMDSFINYYVAKIYFSIGIHSINFPQIP